MVLSNYGKNHILDRLTHIFWITTFVRSYHNIPRNRDSDNQNLLI